MMKLQVCYLRHERIKIFSCQRSLLKPHAILSLIHLNNNFAQNKQKFKIEFSHQGFIKHDDPCSTKPYREE
jgi:hypothetical protein